MQLYLQFYVDIVPPAFHLHFFFDFNFSFYQNIFDCNIPLGRDIPTILNSLDSFKYSKSSNWPKY